MQRIGLTLLGLLFVLLWSSGWTASHYAITSSSALSILSARYVIVVCLLFFIVTLMRQWQPMPRHEIMFHLLIGVLCHALYLLGCLSAFEYGVSATAVAFVNALQPMATASIAGVLTGELTPTRHYKGLLLGMLSVALIFSDSYNQSSLPSFALALPFIAMLALSLGLVLNRRQEIRARASNKQSRPLMLLLLLHTTGASIVIVPLTAINGELHWEFSGTQWGAITWLSTAVSLGSYTVLLFLLRHMSSVQISSLTYLVPPATMLQSYVMFGEKLSATATLALCIASVAVYCMLPTSSATSRCKPSTMQSAGLARLRLARISQPLARIDIEL
ncbi:MAG: DMT family transporter [Granulosicoccus sp.]